jgi:adenylate cyclase
MKQWLWVGPLMSGERVERRLAAILAGDIAGYSRLMGADEEGTLAALKALRRELVDPKIKEYRGRIVKTTGDGMPGDLHGATKRAGCYTCGQSAVTILPRRATRG